MSANVRTLPVKHEKDDPDWGVKPQLKDIPAALQAVKGWILWTARWKPGKAKPDKVPRDRNGSPVNMLDESKWMTFEDVVKAYGDGTKFSGIGLVMKAFEEKVIGIDVDGCRDPDTGELDDRGNAFVESANTYVEISPSGKGLRAYALGDQGEFTHDGVEVYNKDSRRFLTITGVPCDVWNTTATETVEPLSKPMASMLQSLRPATADLPADSGGSKKPLPDWPIDRARGLLEALRAADPARWDDEGDWMKKLVWPLHHQGEGDPNWMELAAEFSHDDASDELVARWDRATADRSGGVTFASLIQEAKDDHRVEFDVSRVRAVPEDFPLIMDEETRERLTLTPDAPELLNAAPVKHRKPVGGRFDFITPATVSHREAEVYVVEDLLAFGARSYVLASPNTGKSALALEFARCVATGEPLNGQYEVAQGPVLYWAAEAPRSIARRMDALRESGKVKEDTPLIVPNNLNVDLMSPIKAILTEMVDLFEEVKKLYGRYPVLLIIDTLSDAAPGNDESTGPTKAIWANINKLSRHLALSHTMVIHHFGKDESKGGRGSIAGNGSTDVELSLKESNGSVSVKKTKSRDDGNKDEELFTFKVVSVLTGKKSTRKDGSIREEDAGVLSWSVEAATDVTDPMVGMTPRQKILWDLIVKGTKSHAPNGTGSYDGAAFGGLKDDWVGAFLLSEGYEEKGKTNPTPHAINQAFSMARAQLRSKQLADIRVGTGNRSNVTEVEILGMGADLIRDPGSEVR